MFLARASLVGVNAGWLCGVSRCFGHRAGPPDMTDCLSGPLLNLANFGEPKVHADPSTMTGALPRPKALCGPSRMPHRYSNKVRAQVESFMTRRQPAGARNEACANA